VKRAADESQLVEMLAQGFSMPAIAKALGYRTPKGVTSSMKRRRIRRLWVDSSVPVVEVSR
jgi:DNA-binding NarL/FixJ family response regulator